LAPPPFLVQANSPVLPVPLGSRNAVVGSLKCLVESIERRQDPAAVLVSQTLAGVFASKDLKSLGFVYKIKRLLEMQELVFQYRVRELEREQSGAGLACIYGVSN
jgi:hypothetical protein